MLEPHGRPSPNPCPGRASLGLFPLLCAAEDPTFLGSRPGWTWGRRHSILPHVPKCASHLGSWAQCLSCNGLNPPFPPIAPIDLGRGRCSPDAKGPVATAWFFLGILSQALWLPWNLVIPFSI